MPIIGTVGAKSPKVRILNALIHLVLCLGAVTMVYPMMLMVSGSVKSNLDKNEMDPIPQYFRDEVQLFRKYVEAKYNEKVDFARAAHRTSYFSFEDVEKPEFVVPQYINDWKSFLASNPPPVTQFEAGFAAGAGIIPKNWRLFKNDLRHQYDGSLENLNDDLGTYYNTWWEMVGSSEGLHLRSGSLVFSPMRQKFQEYKKTLPLADIYVYSLSGQFIEDVLKVRYATRLQQLNEKLGTSFVTFRDINLTPDCPPEPMREPWLHYVRNSSNLQYVKVREPETENYRRFLAERYSNSIEQLNDVYGTKHRAFSAIALPAEFPTAGAAYADWEHFVVNQVAPENLYLEAAEFAFRDYLKQKYPTIDALNTAYQLGYLDFDHVPLPERAPLRNEKRSADWLEFVRNQLSFEHLQLDSSAQADYLAFLKRRFPHPSDSRILDVTKMNETYGARHASELDIVMPKPPLKIRDQELEDWKQFVLDEVNPVYYRIHPERFKDAWHGFLAERHGTIDTLNREWKILFAGFDEVSPPYLMTDWQDLMDQKGAVFWEFFWRNYKMVVEYLVLHGRGLWNTVVYCGLTVIGLLIVNPIAAYALSRYRLPSSYKILLFCMLTMAFPPVVLGIPSFLLLKRLGLLNTFAALILPGIANGYSIFLLKGFFDSLPQELYEAAIIDGANEFRMFWQLTMALSKPILAVIALQGFSHAYANFMLAFIVCQDERMWTLMVWLYQLQQMASQPVVFASLLVAAAPTLLLFVFCQNIILRGIVVPVEK